MPLVRFAMGFRLVCLNGCVPPNATTGFESLAAYGVAKATTPGPIPSPPSTMRMATGWNALTVVEPPAMPSSVAAEVTDPVTGAAEQSFYEPMFGPRFVPGSGTPVRIYICEVCGYVELYAGGIVEPKTWGAHMKAGGSGG